MNGPQGAASTAAPTAARATAGTASGVGSGVLPAGAISAAGSGPRKWATDDDFNRFRAVITELYEQETLSQLMETMEVKYGFMAT